MSPLGNLGNALPGFAPGKEVLKRYSLSRLLGRGGMGVVWLARDLELERDVALKFISEAIAADKVAVDDLKREVRRAIDLSHPNIVKIYDFVTDGSVAGISMELVLGSTLSEHRLDLPGRVFSLQALESVVGQLCSALCYAHTDAQVVHRDLKPANIMLTSDGRVKILDFGIAASISESASRVSNKGSSGTLAYMSPQQLLGRAPCPSDDIYALGATMYEMFTSKPPFFRGDVTHQTLHDLPPTLATRRAELALPAEDPVPEAWEKIVAACLAKEPTGRPASIAEVARELGLGGSLLESGQTFRVRDIISAVVAPAPAALKPPRRSMPLWLKWVLTSLAIAGGLAGIFFGVDVPSRLRARWLVSHATTLPDEALSNAQQASQLRPQDPEYAKAYEAAQQQRLATLRHRLDRLVPAEKLAVLEQELRALEPLLVQSHRDELAQWRQSIEEAIRTDGKAKLAAAEEASKAGRYSEALTLLASLAGSASFLPELGATRIRVQAAAARSEFDHALDLFAQGDYPGALSELENAEKSGLNGDEVRTAKTRIYRAAEPVGVQKLYQVVSRQGSPEEVQAVIDEYARTTGRTLTTTGQALQAERKFDRFLGMLEEIHLRSPEMKSRQQAGNLALIAARRNQFDQPSRVAGFLARNYLDWAAQELQEKNPGFALYLESLARAEGSAGDSGIQRAALSGQSGDFNLELAIARPEFAASPAAVVAAAAREAIQRALNEKIGPWFRIRSPDTSDPTTPFVIRLRAQGPLAEQQKQSRTAIAEYQNGTVAERNPQWLQKKEELDAAMADAKRYDSTTQKALQALVPKMTIKGKPLFTTSADHARQKVALLTSELNDIPQTVDKPLILQEPYKITSIKTRYRVDVTAQLESRGGAIDHPKAWQASTTHLSEEVSGNPAHNVPVKAAENPEMGSIARLLADDIAEQAPGVAQAWLPVLCETSFDLLRQRLLDAKTTPERMAEREWELEQYWEKSGIVTSDRTRIEQAVREQLGLK